MKKEIPPGLIVVALVVVVGGIIAFFTISNNQGTEKVNIESLDPESLRDPDPRSEAGRRSRPDSD